MTTSPALDPIARKTSATPSFREVVARLERGERSIELHGLPTTLAAFLVTHVQRSLPRPLLVVTADEDRAEQWRDDLQAIAGEEIVRYFPAWDVDLYDRRSPSQEISGLRIEALDRLARKRLHRPQVQRHLQSWQQNRTPPQEVATSSDASQLADPSEPSSCPTVRR